MIVVDSTVVAYFVIKGANTASSEAVRTFDPEWIAPSLIRYEVISVVSDYLSRDILSRDEAIRAYRRALTLVKITESPFDPVRILNLHSGSGCTTYDCQFVALAEQMNVRLVTSDKEVLTAFPNLAAHPAKLQRQK